MNSSVIIGKDEVVHVGGYIIPLITPSICIFINERRYTFKISFEEFIDEKSSNETFKRMKVNKASNEEADITLYYRSDEKSFSSTRTPNNLFFIRTEIEKGYIKTQYQFVFHAELNKKNSIFFNIQVTKTPGVILQDNSDEQ
ncbi:hypothetical protein ROK90_22270 [Cronobacter dublinensis]|uniref:hypothetical protein n=1 Tax=Cronobacter dublinensis TaxID=413497 RepID=UPI002895301E|nr:hypothetical protein [Cronobacter dublinensis]MDT3668690.1 hypothetical protein [Cronobacter dublinensis]